MTHLDGLVLARSVFEHAVNYRSAMIYGTPRLVTDREEKLAGLRSLAEHIVPGQWDYARRPNKKELAKTSLLALALDEASVKIRTGPPDDGDSPDAALPVWAGVLPLAAAWQAPDPDPVLPASIPLPPPWPTAPQASRKPSGPPSLADQEMQGGRNVPVGPFQRHPGVHMAQPEPMSSAAQDRQVAPADRRWLVLVVAAIAQLMVVLDSTVVNIALPSAQQSLGFPTTSGSGW